MKDGDWGDITDVTGIEVGHAQDDAALTGCTVVLCKTGAMVGVDVRGGAPGTRETDLCRPGTLVKEAHAVFLTGGSAFGLDATGGVMRWLWERGYGFDAGVARVPIVPAAVIFDLGFGAITWPDAAMAYAACESASDGRVRQGCLGAGMGATVGKRLGMERATKSGVGTAGVRVGDVIIGALMVVNAFGDVFDTQNGMLAGGARQDATGVDAQHADTSGEKRAVRGGTNTTIGVIATDARLSSENVNRLATAGQSGLARAIRPAHTMVDGDTLFALATGRSEAPVPPVLALEIAAAQAVERAILQAVLSAWSLAGVPAARDLTT